MNVRFDILVLSALLAGLPFLLPKSAAGAGESRCQDFRVSKGDGQGLLRYCDDGVNQKVFLSGDLDSKRDQRSVIAVRKLMQRRNVGTFKVVTQNAGGGEVPWHQSLMMGVEDSCIGNCLIQTQVYGKCDSACNQLHLTCVRGASTRIMAGGKMLEHATTGSKKEGCRLCDPRVRGPCNICGAKESVAEYRDRCDRLLTGRGLDIDPRRQQMVFRYVQDLASLGYFNTTLLQPVSPPWAQVESQSNVRNAIEGQR